GITRVPAEILGVAERVGSLAPGRDADLLVLTGEPLDINAWVESVYVGGELVFEGRGTGGQPAVDTAATQPAKRPVVVRAGMIWVGDGRVIRDGSLLIQDGKIQAVGQRVPHPPFARIVDAGADACVVPGFIDAQGHLGLAGDRTVASPDVAIHRAVAPAEREFLRVARAGVTTVLLAPYRAAPNGARLAAVKSWGADRDALVARELTGVRFSLRGQDPLSGVEALRRTIEAGKKYEETWKKYEEELAKWRAGKVTKPEEKPDTVTETGKPDPITGTWTYTVSGDPLPQPVSGTCVLKLTGNTIEGRLSDPESGEDTPVRGTLEGDRVTLEIEQDTPVGRPTIRATLDREDHMTGAVEIDQFRLGFEATRTSKEAVEFKVQVTRKRTKDGRPTPPKVDENLEPLRPLLAGRIPAVVEVQTAAQIVGACKLFVDELKLPLVLLGADDAATVVDQLIARKDRLGVVVPPDIERRRQRRPYCPAVDLSRSGVPVALQSDAEDAARDLPLVGLFAVREGLGGDAALRALTIDAARMYKLDDRLGSLEPGKDADVLIYRGYPFDAGARLERVFVAGEEVPGAGDAAWPDAAAEGPRVQRAGTPALQRQPDAREAGAGVGP
ncbi:MAG: amidohydrolase family protein, partial [Planctomycetota bacterium]